MYAIMSGTPGLVQQKPLKL